MKLNHSYLSIALFFATILTACGGGGDITPTVSGGNSAGSTRGTISLSGNDTTIVGSRLDTGFVRTSVAAGGLPDYIMIVDSASTVEFTAPNILTPKLADPNNGFVLVVTDDTPGSGTQSISMSIWVSGTQYDYACTTPVSVFIECGANSISLNIPNKIVSFDNLTVTNTNTSTILTMDGTLTW